MYGYTNAPRPDRRFKAERKTAPKIKMLWPRHHEMARQLALGANNQQVAALFGCTTQSVSDFRNSTLGRERVNSFMEKRDEVYGEVADEIAQFAPMALEFLKKIVTGEEEAPMHVRAKYADALLEKAGHSTIKKVAIHNHITRTEIETIKARAIRGFEETQNGRSQTPTVDVEFVAGH